MFFLMFRAAFILPLFLVVLTLSALGQLAPKAVPLEEDDVPRAIPVQPGTTMVAPSTAPAKPKGPDEDLFDYASMIYDRAEYGIAAQSFGQYLQNYPSGRHVPLALFRIGECYMNQQQMKVAETYYQEVVSRYPNSEGAPSAAYRLGAMMFNDRNFDQSARMFALCETKSTLLKVRLAASFNKARAYQMLGDTKRQVAALNAVVSVKTDNPYREPALLSLGTVLLAEDKKTEALPLFLDLIQASKDNATISEACVKAGVLLGELERPDEAVPLFERALKIGETTSAARGIALVGVVQALFAKGNYDGVISNYNQNASVLPEGETRPKMLLLVGNAYRMKRSYARAVEVYLMIEQSNPESDQAFEAGYWKLYCFYLLDDKDLVEFATAFITRHSDKRASHEFLNLARLIRADFHFNKQNYADAASSFQDVSIEKLTPKLQPGTLFNKGWAQAESGRSQDAISTFTQFLASHPNHELTSKALARRGLAYRETKDLVKALSDFQSVVKDHPNSEAVELAYLQMGLIASEQRDHKATIAAYEMLVKKYPTSAAAGQAWFGIGRASFSIQMWDKAIQALEKAIEFDRKTYLDPASLMIIQAQYVQQNTEALAKAIDAFRQANPHGVIPPNVLTWLGLKLYDQKAFARSTQYLSLASTPDVPENTDPRVWNYLGMAFLETKDYESCVKATDHFLKVTPESAARARGLMTKGRGLLGQNKFDEADAVVQEGLGFAKDGKPQAMLLLLQGEVLMAQGDKMASENKAAEAQTKYAEAAGKFMIPAQFFDDEEITPQALSNAAKALQKAGQPDKADEFLKQLKSKYPNYSNP
jgi:TolA-binding protein